MNKVPNKLWRGVRLRLVILSIAAGVGLVVLWVRSHFALDIVGYESIAGQEYAIGSERGSLGVATTPSPSNSGFRYLRRGVQTDQPPLGEGNTFLGFRWRHSARRLSGGTELIVVFPHAAALVVVALPAMIFWRAVRRERNRPEFACAACGYDLRATPERCPECGTIPAETAAKQIRGLGASPKLD